MSPIMPAPMMSGDRMTGMAISFFLHAFLFVGGGLALMQPAEYAVESGGGGMEIHLTAAPAEPVLPQEAVMAQEIADPESVVPVPQTPVQEKRASSSTGKDAVTFHSSAGAVTEAKPDYLKNPAPAYPWEARQNGWEGVVVIRVVVSPSGQVLKAEKEKGSGYEVLDQSAMKTVRSWRFRPAKMGALPVESTVRVPVRFTLDKKK